MGFRKEKYIRKCGSLSDTMKIQTIPPSVKELFIYNMYIFEESQKNHMIQELEYSGISFGMVIQRAWLFKSIKNGEAFSYLLVGRSRQDGMNNHR